MNERDAPTDLRRPRSPDPEEEFDDEGGVGRRVSPGLVFLVVAIVGSVAYMGYTVTVREASQIPLLASGAVVLAVVFGILAAYSLRATWRAGEDRGRRALLIALVGGGAAIAAAGFLAGAIILFQVASGPG